MPKQGWMARGSVGLTCCVSRASAPILPIPAIARLARVVASRPFGPAAGGAGWVRSGGNANGRPPRGAAALGLEAARWRVVQRTLRSLRAAVQSLRTANPALMALAFGGSVLHVCFKVATLPMLVFLGDPSFAPTMDSLAPLVLWPLALFYGGVVVPAPGGGGFIEGAFAATLSNAIPAGIFAAALLWWRFYTFYLYILIGGVAAGDAALRALRPRDATLSSPLSQPSAS